MVLVRENKELWVGCGNKIVIVDAKTLRILDEIAVYQTQRTHVRIMVTDGARVWNADRKSTKILQWEVSTRQLTHIFDCDVDSAVGKVLCSEAMEPRRKERQESLNRVRDGPISDPLDSFDQPSYTEAMFKEAMNREANEDVKTESLRKYYSFPRNTPSPGFGISEDEDSDISAKSVSPPVSIPGSQARFLRGKASQETLPSRGRSLSAKTESSASLDSGISSLRITSITRSDTERTVKNTSSSNLQDDLQDEKAPLRETCEEVHSKVEQMKPFDTEQELDSIGGLSTESHKRSTIDQQQDSSETENIGSCSSKSEPDTQQVGTESVITSDEKVEELDGDQNEAQFELVDKEETRQAFVEGTKKVPRSDEGSSQHCPSMDTLQMRFNSSSRAPSLISSQRRRSQRRPKPQENNNNNNVPPTSTKPWARRPRLRILAGSINRVTALLLVNGTLWIGRGVGDILTVNVNSADNGLPPGHVFAQLETDNLLGYQNGQVDEIVTSGTSKIVCLRRLELDRGSTTNEDQFTERYQLTVWEAWGETEFRRFKDRLDDFNALVE